MSAEEFDEAWYLSAYPDVARAVELGLLQSAYEHYREYGYKEGRLPHASASPTEPAPIPAPKPRVPAAPPEPTPLPALKPLDWPAISVETAASESQLRAILARVKHNFEFMAEREPHWSVLTSERYLRENLSQNQDEFFASGKHPVDEFVATVERCGIKLPTTGTCIELGCGVGRSTIWLAKIFKQVLGCDISAPHLRVGEDTARDYHLSNIEFFEVIDAAAIAKLPKFDVFFSIIVLQHNPPPIILSYLDCILTKLNPGGLAYFQVPSYRLGYEFSIAEYLETDPTLGQPEMHLVPQHELFALFERKGCRLLEVREDGATGDNWHISQRFLLAKAAYRAPVAIGIPAMR